MRNSLQIQTRRRRQGVAVVALLAAVLVLARAARAAGADEVRAPGRGQLTVTDADRHHWAFRPLAAAEPPVTRLSRVGADLASTAADAFWLAALEQRGLVPAPPAAKRRLIRRATFDLLGLPPSPAEVDAFLADASPSAFSRLADRLLASPHHGERWGRHWLDLARYADSDGYENDRDRPLAFPYRDFVIWALNADLPFDVFVRWQIAGDEAAPQDPLAVAATGFCAAAPSQMTTPSDTDENKLKVRHDELDNVLSTIGSAMLGLTIGCARCHDHKFEPLSSRDYYSMLAAFGNAGRVEAPLSKPRRDLERWLERRRAAYREHRMAQLGLSEEEKFWLRHFRSEGVPIVNLKPPAGLDPGRQRRMLDLAAALNAGHARDRPGEEHLLARLASYELAFKMQSEASGAIDFSNEPEPVRRRYGLDEETTRPFGAKCLLARRLVERGVRFVQVYCNDEWDAHQNLLENHTKRAAETDKPVAGLLADLKERGLLESTLVVWGGEFGRMPVSEKGNGRDHNPHGFLVWLAGGGIRGGVSHGETDEIGWKAAVDPVSVHDLHATILHLLGIDHTRLVYTHNGRRFRLTDVAGEVITPILA